MDLNQNFWNQKWVAEETGWDIGHASPALVTYFEHIENKEAKILIPGCGNAYEADVLIQIGFQNITLVDISIELVNKLKEKYKDVQQVKVLHINFFELEETFDYIMEQTFFCAINPSERNAYVQKVQQLLNSNGILFGLLFNRTFKQEGPPFGGDIEEYRTLFTRYFNKVKIEVCTDSILPRKGTEVFIEIKK